ncbi:MULTISPECIES: hypothetical protein [Enterobacteriaceae]|jgi:hypothetical protein|uniref:Uncharacterized protein n=1 Tax=Citrobacter bitternis TaxID=1585982 RepID=A0ABW1Q0J3_9ENTR|nr:MULTISPECIES: hypothetical protein [Enterobacteriaceae]AUU90090.1 hypothetical protein C2U55_13895 [Enterobacteriaceae bacterium ENNIH3]AUV09823.1 hypothetical protein C2U52_27985 [Enterobacteriaceae bacterium ENNIH2]MBS6739443.1 hypothetical protein [Enterobacteriaceae bacterium]PTA96602.1 hypothetical protein C9415_05190 [Kluyvera sp. Nf5]PWF51397.1 hypothetical protein BHT19_0010755 [[Kluyvera] intestini]PXW55422.1 hypothetical protein DFO55_10880 [Grimontella sp. AG753]SLK16769.1 hypo
MNTFPLPVAIHKHNADSAVQLQHYLEQNRQNPALIPILNMDLTFISPHARSTNDFVISRVEHLHDNTYVLYYQINYFIFNLCQDMNIEDVYETSISFNVVQDYLAFTVIHADRDTVDEF